MKFCKECGQKWKHEKAQFCTNCGISFAKEEKKVEETEAPVEVEQEMNDSPEEKQEEAIPLVVEPEPELEEEVKKEKEPAKKEVKKAKKPAKEKKKSADQTPSKKQEKSPEEEPKRVTEKRAKTPKKVTKKQKTIGIISAIILLLCIGFYFTMNYITSEKRLVNTYKTAVKDKDATKLGEMLAFSHNEEAIGKENAEAFIAMLDEHADTKREILGKLNKQAADEFERDNGDLITIVDGDPLLFFKTYDLVIEPVSVDVYTNVDGATLLVDKEEIATIDEAHTSYEHGPLVPGSYTFSAALTHDHVELEKEEEVTFVTAGHAGAVELIFDVSYVDFEMSSFDDLDKRLLVNGEAVDFDFGEKSFGPILAEETEIAVEVDFPWGTMRSKPDYPESSYEAVFSLDDEMEKDVTKAIQAYHKKYWAAWEKNDRSEFNYLSEGLQSDMQYTFSDYHHGYYFDEDETIERKSVSASIDKDDIVIVDGDKGYTMLVWMEEAYELTNYVDPDDKNKTTERSYDRVELNFDKELEVYYIHEQYERSMENPIDIELDDKVYTINPKKKADKKKDKDAEEAGADGSSAGVSEAVDDYMIYLVEAINDGDYSIVKPYIKDGSPLHDMQTGLVDRLYKNGTTQELVSASVENISEDGNEWKVTTKETVKIIYESGKDETKSYTWKYTVVDDGGTYRLTNIE